jgi:uncharacterized protein
MAVRADHAVRRVHERSIGVRRAHPLTRALWVSLALGFLLLAVLGVVLPGLPTTPFVLLAAWAAARGSRRLNDWLLAHHIFGPTIRNWITERAVTRKAKRAATATMLACTAILVFTAPHWGIAAAGCSVMAAVGTWLWRRPEPRLPT